MDCQQQLARLDAMRNPCAVRGGARDWSSGLLLTNDCREELDAIGLVGVLLSANRAVVARLMELERACHV